MSSTVAVQNDIPNFALGAVIDIPTGRIAQRLGVETPIIEKALCCLVESIDVQRENRFIARGLVPVENPCKKKGEKQDCGSIAHKLYFGVKNPDCPPRPNKNLPFRFPTSRLAKEGLKALNLQ